MSNATAEPVYRVDSFVVPENALAPFMQRVNATHQTLQALPGCQKSLVLKKVGGAGETNVVTIVEWASTEAIDAALQHMKRKYAEQGYDPTAFLSELGIRADLGIYAGAPGDAMGADRR